MGVAHLGSLPRPPLFFSPRCRPLSLSLTCLQPGLSPSSSLAPSLACFTTFVVLSPSPPAPVLRGDNLFKDSTSSLQSSSPPSLQAASFRYSLSSQRRYVGWYSRAHRRIRRSRSAALASSAHPPHRVRPRRALAAVVRGSHGSRPPPPRAAGLQRPLGPLPWGAGPEAAARRLSFWPASPAPAERGGAASTPSHRRGGGFSSPPPPLQTPLPFASLPSFPLPRPFVPPPSSFLPSISEP